MRLLKIKLLKLKDKIAIIKYLKLKFKAGILPLVLALSMIMSLFCGSAIILVYYKNLLWIRAETISRLEFNAYSAIELTFSKGLENLILDSPTCIDVYNEGRDSVQLVKNSWGIFDWLSVNAFSGNFSCSKNVLVGYSSHYLNPMGLYISNSHSNPLTMIGNSQIVGDAWLPTRGVKTGFLNRQGFIGDILIDGEILKSEITIPEIRQEIFAKLKKTASLEGGKRVTNNEPIVNSFLNPPLIINSEESIFLDKTLKGHVVVFSSSEIIIQSSAILDDVILVAPVIKFETGFRGCLQAIAGEKIIMEPGVRLNYPSALITSQNNSLIEINSACLVEGLVMSIVDDQSLIGDSEGIIYLAEGSIVDGQVISNSRVQHYGLINGQLICKSLVVLTNSGEYINYLSGGSVNRKMLSNLYLFNGIFECEMVNPKVLINLY